MKNKLIITVITSFLLASSLFAFANNTIPALKTDNTTQNEIKLNVTEKPTGTTTISTKAAQTPPINASEYTNTNALDIVNNPTLYLNKKVKFKADFDKFSTLGLDYKPAFKDSQKYISFLIKRPDIKDHTVPMSEMKIFITREEAEKFIELDSGDIIEIYGTVFSNALTDAWVNVEKLVIIEKINKDKKSKD